MAHDAGCPADWRLEKYPDGTRTYICDNCGAVRRTKPGGFTEGPIRETLQGIQFIRMTPVEPAERR